MGRGEGDEMMEQQGRKGRKGRKWGTGGKGKGEKVGEGFITRICDIGTWQPCVCNYSTGVRLSISLVFHRKDVIPDKRATRFLSAGCGAVFAVQWGGNRGN